MAETNSQKQILKSTGIIGGTQVFNIIIGLFRTKIAAILLGPEGIGILGILQSTIDMIRNASSFGISFSGVKDIAEAADSKDKYNISKTIYIVRKWVWVTGLFGLLIGSIFCVPFSIFIFGDQSIAGDIAISSISVFLSTISAGQIALLQGLRRISQMAKATLIGSFIGTVLTICLYYFLGRRGIVPGLIAVSFCSLFISWIYTKDISVCKIKLTFKEIFFSGLQMAKTGGYIVISGFGVAFTMYLLRGIIMHKVDNSQNLGSQEGLAAVGLFQSVWTISRTYMGTLTNAMLADFFPRLSAINKNNIASNKLINEQLEITLILGTPLIVCMIVFAPLVMKLLYSSSFSEAVPLLQWQMVGTYFTLLTWPLGVMFLSKSRGEFCILNDLSWCICYILAVSVSWNYFGFLSLGIVYLIAGAINSGMVIIEVRKLGGFKFSSINLKYILLSSLIILFTFMNTILFRGNIQLSINFIFVSTTIIYSLYKLRDIIDLKRLYKRR